LILFLGWCTQKSKQMNWTNLQEIEQKIVEKQYTDKEAFYYFLGTAIIYTLSYFLIDQVYKGLFKLIVIPAAVITIIGSIYCFKVYSKNGAIMKKLSNCMSKCSMN